MIKHVKGNLITMAKAGKFDTIMHGCNIWNTMGAGIALQIKKEFPDAYAADLRTVKGDVNKLGKYSVGIHKIEDSKWLAIINAYTQQEYGAHGDVFEYDKFKSFLKHIKPKIIFQKIGMPLIGCGHARGDKERILSIIEETIGDLDVTIVEYNK